MPCTGLVAYRAKLTPDVAAELLSSPAALEAIPAGLQGFSGGMFTLRASERTHNHNGGSSYAAAWIESGRDVQVIINGREITVQGSDRVRVEQARAYVEGLGGQIAFVSARDRTIAALKAKYVVTGDGRTSLGNRVLRLSI